MTAGASWALLDIHMPWGVEMCIPELWLQDSCLFCGGLSVVYSLQQAAVYWTCMVGAVMQLRGHCVATRLSGATDTAGHLTDQASKSACVFVFVFPSGWRVVKQITHN